jgi:uncharacterized membrane protein
MSAGDVVGIIAVFFSGLLAGEELVIRLAVRGPLASLDDRPHIQMRQALIRTMRVLVPAMFAAAFLSAVSWTALARLGSGYLVRGAGVVVLLVWLGLTVGGTVPINAAAIEWDPSDPPRDWRAQIGRWERLNSIRMSAAVVAFALLLTGFVQAAALR